MSAEIPQPPSQPELPGFSSEDVDFLKDLNREMYRYDTPSGGEEDPAEVLERVFAQEDADETGSPLSESEKIKRDDDLLTFLALQSAIRTSYDPSPGLITPEEASKIKATTDRAYENARKKELSQETAKYQQTHMDGGQSIDREE